MRMLGWTTATLLLMVMLAGCGGGGGDALVPAPGAPGGGDGTAGTLEIGPMVIRPASTANFVAQNMPNDAGNCAFAALYGATIDYLASQALLDRIVFSSERDSFHDIWVCDLDGSNLTQLTNNGASESGPEWSPDGTKITFYRQWPASDYEIMTMRADGSSITAVTNNTDDDHYPTWSPDGRMIAFMTDRDGNEEIYTMYENGDDPVNLTNHANKDYVPDWSPDESNPDIVWATRRDGHYEVYKMDDDGSNPTRLTNGTHDSYDPTWNATGSMIAWSKWMGSGYDIFQMSSSGANQRNFTRHTRGGQTPAYSSDGRWIAFRSPRGAAKNDIWLQQTDAPYHAFQVTDDPETDTAPNLGSPTMQTERVLIGPNGSDWGGLDPIWTKASAGIVAFDGDGYRNFVRIGVRPGDLDTLDVSPMASTGWDLCGVLVEAAEIVNLKQDAGRGLEPTTWLFDAHDPGAALLYFNADTGKLVSVLLAQDSVYPSAAGTGGAISQSVEGEGLVIQGRFSAVYDAQGDLVASDGATRVVLSAAGEVVSAN